MKTKIATIAQTFQHGNHLTDAEMTLLASRLDEALAMMKAVGASHVTIRGVFEAFMSCTTALYSRKVPFKGLDFDAQAAAKTEIDSVLSIIKIGGALPDTVPALVDRLWDAGETIDALAQDKILAKCVWQPLDLIAGYLAKAPSTANEAEGAPSPAM